MIAKLITEFRQEARSVFTLAWPLVLAEIGWMAMAIVDTIMVGRMPNSAEAIGGVALGGVIFYTAAIFGGSLLFSLDAKVSQSFGAGDLEDANHSLLNALYIALPLAPALMLIIWQVGKLLPGLGINPGVLTQTIPFLRAMNWSTAPLLLYFAFRRYLQAVDLVRPVTFALISANIVNLVGDWALIYGHLGARAFGVAGSGWSTCISRIYMAGLLFAVVLWQHRKQRIPLFQRPYAPDFRRIGELLSIGLPAAVQILFEIGVFATVTALIAKLDAVSVAAHQIALNCASFTYMVPLGISSAAAVRVGQALGRREPAAAGRAGWTAIAMGAAFMSAAAVVLVVAPKLIVRIFTPDRQVMEVGVKLLFVAAAFQLFDGLQTVATGALRGTGETRIPMVSSFIAYWVIGLPLGYYLGFKRHLGAVGLWDGLALGLVLIAAALVWAWQRQVRQVIHDFQAMQELTTDEVLRN
ncbi:MAG: MATE family efflux transporter [Acidobacteria bacterium]|nr:MATE family efflux transporter [Acidobacteriota bacterium]MBV9147580.1 MATE family efflux transporter [Acidobacteriota bacterium]